MNGEGWLLKQQLPTPIRESRDRVESPAHHAVVKAILCLRNLSSKKGSLRVLPLLQWLAFSHKLRRRAVRDQNLQSLYTLFPPLLPCNSEKQGCFLQELFIGSHAYTIPLAFLDYADDLVTIHVSWMCSHSENGMVNVTGGHFLYVASEGCHFISTAALHQARQLSDALLRSTHGSAAAQLPAVCALDKL